MRRFVCKRKGKFGERIACCRLYSSVQCQDSRICRRSTKHTGNASSPPRRKKLAVSKHRMSGVVCDSLQQTVFIGVIPCSKSNSPSRKSTLWSRICMRNMRFHNFQIFPLARRAMSSKSRAKTVFPSNHGKFPLCASFPTLNIVYIH